MKSFISRIFGSSKTQQRGSPLDLDPSIPKRMVDIAMPVILMQTMGTKLFFFSADGTRKNDAAGIFCQDDYCIGYLTGLLDVVSQKWGMSHEQFMLVMPAAYGLFAIEANGDNSFGQDTQALATSMVRKFQAARETEPYALGQMNGGEDMIRFARDGSESAKHLRLHHHATTF